MTARADIAAAATTVQGITCTPFYSADTSPGSAFVRLGGITWPNKFGAVNTWVVVLMLPQDLADAERMVEAQVPLIATALRHELDLDGVTLQRLDIPGAGVLPTAFITGTREG